MSATADGPRKRRSQATLWKAGHPFLRDSESHYSEAIEKAFVRLRGSPLLLSPADSLVIRRWHDEGVPLGLIVATLEEVFAKRRERGAKGRINGIRYCAQAVDAAWAEVRELQGPPRRAAVSETPLEERLQALADALPEGLAARAAWRGRLLALAGPAEAVEGSLRALDDELLAAADAVLSPEARERLEGEVAAILTGLRDRFPDSDLAALRSQLRRQRLRRNAGLPVLTLF